MPANSFKMLIKISTFDLTRYLFIPSPIIFKISVTTTDESLATDFIEMARLKPDVVC